METTALVNDSQVEWQHAPLFAVAAKIIRQILVGRARQDCRKKLVRPPAARA
jgi:hypothetical protein